MRETDIGATAVVAHPDDLPLNMGGVLAQCVKEGRPTYVIMVTDGGNGNIATPKVSPEMMHDLLGEEQQKFEALIRQRRNGKPVDFGTKRPGDDIFDIRKPKDPQWLSQKRREETLEEARRLGIPKEHVLFLGVPDGQVGKDSAPLIERAMRETNTHLYITHDTAGHYGHPDHVATSIAVHRAADEITARWRKSAGRNHDPKGLPDFNLRRVLEATLPDADQRLTQYVVVQRPANELIVADVGEEAERVIHAAQAHESQMHLVEVFRYRGIIGREQEVFYDPPSNLVPTGERTGNIFQNISSPPIPNGHYHVEPASRYKSNIPEYHTRVQRTYDQMYREQ